MLTYLFLLQVLFVGELFSWESFPEVSPFESSKYYEEVYNEKQYAVDFKEGKVFQPQDHFDLSTIVPWVQQYFVNAKYYKPGGPVFLMIGTIPAPHAGIWLDYAKRVGAICYFLVHRYYGETHPVPDSSAENLKYLNSEQALQDAANFIRTMTTENQFPPDTKWIAMGGGYSGSLATWLRLKYPHLVHGAVASSALLRNTLYGYRDFYDIRHDILNKHTEGCGTAVNESFVELNELMRNESAHVQVEKLFNICETTKKTKFTLLDVATLHVYLNKLISLGVYLNMPSSGFLNRTCQSMTNQTLGTPLQRLSTFVKSTGLSNTCRHVRFNDSVVYLSKTDWTTLGSRPWLYQILTEFGFSPVRGGPNSVPVRHNFRTFSKLGTAVFGRKYSDFLMAESRIRKLPIYGGLNINVTNVVFVQGTADPWYKMGVQNNISSSSPLIVIEGGIHCADMFPKVMLSSPEVDAAREKIVSYIEAWMKE